MDEFIMMPIPAKQFTAVCALLGGAKLATASGNVIADAPKATAAPSEPSGNGAATASSSTSTTAQTDASLSDGDVDAHGWPWSADLHASTKGMTKDGLWRMKVGVSRPDPKPGFPKAGEPTGTSGNGAASEAGGSANSAGASSPAPTNDDEDEFAAFRAAAAQSDANDTAAAASAPARKWTDADLGALCNQAAVKLGDPAPVKEIIASYVPQGEVAHSRNIPEDKRAAFAAAVEAKAGIEFAG